MLYNQYLHTLMDEELKENEGLENIFEQIRDVVLKIQMKLQILLCEERKDIIMLVMK